MSLTKQDLTDIRGVVLDALDTVVNPRFDSLEARVNKLEAGQQTQTDTLAEHSAILREHSIILRDHSTTLERLEGKIDNIDGRLTAIEADIKELYVLVGHKPAFGTDKAFAKLAPAEKLRRLHTEVLTLAEQLHVEL